MPAPEGIAEPSAEGEAAPPSWSTSQTTEELFEHEEIKPHLEERDTATFKRAKEEVKGQTEGYLRRQTQEMQGVNKSLADFTASFQEITEELQTTGNVGELQKLLRNPNTREALETLHGLQVQQGRLAGWTGFVDGVAGATNDPALATEFKGRLMDIAQNMQDETFWTDFVERVTDKARAEGKEEGRKLGNKETEARLVAEARANGRKGEAPPPKVAGSAGGGGKSDREKLVDPNTPVKELMEIRARQRAR